jgi:hypothetical protein
MNAESLDQFRVSLPAARSGANQAPLRERASDALRWVRARFSAPTDVDEPVWPQLTSYPYGPAQN